MNYFGDSGEDFLTELVMSKITPSYTKAQDIRRKFEDSAIIHQETKN
jgi:hypothetical protein